MIDDTYVVLTEYADYGILWVGRDPDEAIKAAEEYVAGRPYDIVVIMLWDKAYRKHIWTVNRTGVRLA